ncbi:MAG: transposase [Phycisphaerae bacterium]|nr:transposase [Phycisphaerae bacterium]
MLEIVKRSDDVAGFAVLPKRWIVERTLGWLGRHRRMSKDYEMLPATRVVASRIDVSKLAIVVVGPAAELLKDLEQIAPVTVVAAKNQQASKPN